MPFLKLIGRMLLQLATFFLLMVVLSKATTFVTAERYAGVGEPNRLFPLVAIPLPPDESKEKYQLLRWGALRNLAPAARFKLPDAAATFTHPVVGGYEPTVEFRSAAEGDGRQRIMVTVTDDDYVLYSTYLTDGTNITPVNFRIWGPSSMLLALIPSVVLTWAFSRMVAWWWRRRKAAEPQAR